MGVQHQHQAMTVARIVIGMAVLCVALMYGGLRWRRGRVGGELSNDDEMVVERRRMGDMRAQMDRRNSTLGIWNTWMFHFIG